MLDMKHKVDARRELRQATHVTHSIKIDEKKERSSPAAS
jgi:hypothetical protein